MTDSKDRPFRDEAAVRLFTKNLIELWDRDRNRTFEMKREYVGTTGPMIWSLTHHAVELSRTIVDLSAQNRMLIALPLIRLVMDNAMTVSWLLVSPDSSGALIHESLRQRKNAVEHIAGLGGEGFDADTIKKAADELDEFSDMKSPQGQYLEQRFKALYGGNHTYSLYRLASSMSHAGMTLADQYLVEVPKTPDAPVGLAFSPDKVIAHTEAWLGMSATMLTLAMTVCDRIESQGRMKNQLAKAAKKLGTEMRIELA